MLTDKKKFVKNTLEEIWKGNLDTVDERFSRDHVGHTYTEMRGREGVKNFFSELRNAFTSLEYIVEDQIAEGDLVATRWTSRGTHQGEFMGVPPNEDRVQISGITISRLSDGRIVEG